MKYIGLHDADKNKHPNFALMKISTWHKSQGDKVDWFWPIKVKEYDQIYSSKIFTFTGESRYLPKSTIKGGTGYDMSVDLPSEIECLKPDYTIYPHVDYSLGFLTRGCSRKCSWCVVPQKEGAIKPYCDIDEIIRPGIRDVVLMDNNVLAHKHGIQQIEKMGGMDLRVDFNQGLDARYICADEGIAKLLAGLKWRYNIRLACDHKGMMPIIEKAVTMLRKHGVKTGFFSYVLVKEIDDALERVEFLRRLKVEPFAQPYRSFDNKTQPTPIQKRFARWVNRHAIFRTVDWKDYNPTQKGSKKQSDSGFGLL